MLMRIQYNPLRYAAGHTVCALGAQMAVCVHYFKSNKLQKQASFIDLCLKVCQQLN